MATGGGSSKSDMWKHLTKTTKKKIVTHNVCSREFTYHGGTSNLCDHLQRSYQTYTRIRGEAADLDCDHAEVFWSEDESNRWAVSGCCYYGRQSTRHCWGWRYAPLDKLLGAWLSSPIEETHNEDMYMYMRISILNFRSRYGHRLWLVGSILTWTLPQNMVRSVEKRTKNIARMEMLMLSGVEWWI